MENKEIDLIQILKSVWVARRKLLKWGVVGLVIGLVVAFSIPREYEAKIEFVLENSQKSGVGSMGAFAGIMGVNIQGVGKEGVNEQLYPQVVKSTPFLTELSEIPVKYDGQTIPLWKYMFRHQKKAWWSYVIEAPASFIGWISSIGDKEQPQPNSLNTHELQLRFAGAIKNKINIQNDSKSSIYTLSVQMQDPVISQQVVDSVIVQLGAYVTQYRTAKAKDNLTSSIRMLADAKWDFYSADSTYAAVADKNQNLVSKSTLIRIERLRNERDIAYAIYQQLSTQVEMDKVKLKEETPIATILEPSFEPQSPAKPNKKLIVIGFVIVAMFGASGVIVVRQLIK